MVPGEDRFYVYFVKVHFYRKKIKVFPIFTKNVLKVSAIFSVSDIILPLSFNITLLVAEKVGLKAQS